MAVYRPAVRDTVTARFVSDLRGVGIVFMAGPFVREKQPQPAEDIHFVAAIAKYRF